MSNPTPSVWKVHRKLLAAVILIVIVLASGVLLFYRVYTATTLSISTTPNPSQSGTTVVVSGRLANGLGAGLVGYDVTVDSSPDGVVWSKLAGPFLTQQSSANSGERSVNGGYWWIQGGWNFSDTTYLRAVFDGGGGYGPSSAIIKQVVNSLPLNQYWATFYYPWYCNATCSPPDTWRHWSDGGYSPPTTWASRFQPDLGLYSSTSVINQDLTWMDDARLDLAIVSWWGESSFEDRAFHLMLNEAQNNASLHLKLAVYYELEGPSFPQPTVDQIVGNLTFIYENLANSTSYFRTGPNHTPAVFVYGDASDAFEYTTRWSTARSRMIAKGEPMFVDLKVFDGYTNGGNDKLVDSWHQYRPDVNVSSANSSPHYELQPGYSALATPGFWYYSEAGPRLVRDATGFRSAVSRMASLTPSEAQFLLIETFNEWHEGSQVEPGNPVDTSVSPFASAGPSYGLTFLDIIKNRG